MSGAVDLDAYFARIGWGGGTAPTFATLSGILRAHTSSVPFENFDVLLGRPVRLDLAALQAKLVGARRGGYCFEQVTLLAAVLEQLGFQPVRHTARVTLFTPLAESPRTHMLLTVALPEGEFVLDPAFGSYAAAAPIPLRDTADAAATHVLVRQDHRWVLRVRQGDTSIDGWSTTLDRDNIVDFELGNHFTATHPGSPFVNRVMLAATTGFGRVTVMNRDATIWRQGTPEPRPLADRAALRVLVAEHFGFDLPDIERLRVPSIPEWS